MKQFVYTFIEPTSRTTVFEYCKKLLNQNKRSHRLLWLISYNKTSSQIVPSRSRNFNFILASIFPHIFFLIVISSVHLLFFQTAKNPASQFQPFQKRKITNESVCFIDNISTNLDYIIHELTENANIISLMIHS